MSETDLDTLLGAVRAHLREEVLPRMDGFDAFGVRIAANAIGIAERELAAQGELQALNDELRSFAPQVPGLSPPQRLACALRDGELGQDDGLISLLRRRAMLRIAIDNPRYSGLAEARRRWTDDVT